MMRKIRLLTDEKNTVARQMRRVVLAVAGGALVLVPVGTVTLLAIFPGEFLLIPVAFWVAWLVVSLIVSLEAPTLADELAPPSRGIHGAIRYARWVMALGLVNLGYGMAVLLWLMWRSPAG
jgi:hypothetical protein